MITRASALLVALALAAQGCGWNSSCHTWWFFEGLACAPPRDASTDASADSDVPQADVVQTGCTVPSICSTGGCDGGTSGYVWNGSACVFVSFACACGGGSGCLFVSPALEICEGPHLHCRTFVPSSVACSPATGCDLDGGASCADAGASGCPAGMACGLVQLNGDAGRCVPAIVAPPCR